MKVTRCLRLPSSDCVVRSVCAAGYCNGRERESTLHDRLFVVTSTHVYFVDDIVLHKVTSNCSSAADTASDHVDDHVDDDFTHDSIASFKMTFASHVSMDFGSPSSANVTTMDPLSVPVPSSVSITNIDPLLVPVPSSVSITNSDPLSVPVPSGVSITNKDPLLVPVPSSVSITNKDPLSVPVPSGVSITNSDPLSVPTLPSGIVYRTRQDLIALGQRELDLFNSRKPTGKAHQKDGIIAKNIPWPADPSIRMEIFLNSR